MSAIAMRALGYGLRRYAPRVFSRMAANYVRNPRAWHAGKKVISRGIDSALLASGVKGMITPPNSALGKRIATMDPEKRSRVAKRIKTGPPAGGMVGPAKSSNRSLNAVYRGQLFKSRRRARSGKSVDFTKFGVKQTIEEYGSVDDNDTVYVLTPCANDVKVLETLIMSLIKKLLVMGIKWNAPSVTEEILYGPGAGSVNPAGLFINLYGGRPDTTDGNYDVVKAYSLADGDSILAVVAQFILPFTQYSQGLLDIGGSVNVNNELYSIVLGSQVRNATNNGGVQQTLAVIYLDEEMVHWRGSSRIKLQNRTNSVTSSTSTDVNDAKPLEGFSYEFQGLPRLRNVQTGKFKVIDSGLNTKTFGAAVVPSDFKEPPPTRIFANCRSKKRIRLDPGQIKEHTCAGSGSMQMKTFLKRLNAEESLSLTIHTMFLTQMYAFEELINSTDVNAVKVGFENTVNLSLTLATKKKKILTMPYYRAINIAETV